MGLFNALRDIKDNLTAQRLAQEDMRADQAASVTSDADAAMEIEDVFTIKGRGTVATGKVMKGSFQINQVVKIQRAADMIPAVIAGIEAFRKELDVVNEGDNCGLLLKDISRDDVHKGDIITA